MHIHQVLNLRRLVGFVGLVTVALTIAPVLGSSAAAQSAGYTSRCTSAPPVLMLDDPNPGDVLPTGDIVFSGVALDPAVAAGAGVTRVGVAR